jgi:formiminoglutamase
MSDIAHFFSPVNREDILENGSLKELQFGNLFSIHSNSGDFPDLTNIDLAIVGVEEDRNSENNHGCALAPNEVRKYLYRLYGGTFNIRVADLGNITAVH